LTFDTFIVAIGGLAGSIAGLLTSITLIYKNLKIRQSYYTCIFYHTSGNDIRNVQEIPVELYLCTRIKSLRNHRLSKPTCYLTSDIRNKESRIAMRLADFLFSDSDQIGFINVNSALCKTIMERIRMENFSVDRPPKGSKIK